MTANVTFVYAERKAVLRIPSAALRFRPPEDLLASGGKVGDGGGKKKKHKLEKTAAAATGSAMSTSAGTGTPTGASASANVMKSVWAVDGDKLKEVQVEIGVSDGNKVEVRNGGLAEGDVLVTDAVSRSERSGKNKGLF
jgi:HlyD family secretion protein